MNFDSVMKYVGCFTILASVFALVVMGKASVDVYIGLASGILSGLGILHASGWQTPPKPPPAPKNDLMSNVPLGEKK